MEAEISKRSEGNDGVRGARLQACQIGQQDYAFHSNQSTYASPELPRMTQDFLPGQSDLSQESPSAIQQVPDQAAIPSLPDMDDGFLASLDLELGHLLGQPGADEAPAAYQQTPDQGPPPGQPALPEESPERWPEEGPDEGTWGSMNSAGTCQQTNHIKGSSKIRDWTDIGTSTDLRTPAGLKASMTTKDPTLL
ncbi:hypothetical protein GMORB2_3876 [Geosmithia morbida]|uniref:Uncharacterized protein n=1 Tax=Geosmithia morbida TaxID=1094350 RepID=A0A9P4YYV0_9HYPO|nr:uncharacterized protein GMORB2_3876 [Geosmithia morbida]KAF4125037.1 hypothetical protein GMORB2_3876 [Geosmithia morbida]